MTKTRESKPKAKPAASEGEDRFVVAHRRKDGTFLHGEGGLPLNHRLRAEDLVRAGLDEDPDELIGADLIADTATRLAAEEEAERETEAATSVSAAAAPSPAAPPPADQPNDAAGQAPAGAANEGTADQ